MLRSDTTCTLKRLHRALMSVGGMVSTGCSCSSGSSSSSRRWRSNTNIDPNVPAALRRHILLIHRSKLQASENRDQQAAPLLDAVLARGNKLETPLHVPGHKRGRALDGGMQQLMMAGATGILPGLQSAGGRSIPHAAASTNPLQYDLTELSGLDYLSSPSSVIKSAQELAASAFGAKHTWFLVNGCSAGIHAAVMATVRPGEALLLARNCHLSAFSACMLSDAVPVWLQPEQDPLHGIAHSIPPAQLKQGFEVAKQRGLKVAAVLVVSPTYYGVLARVSELAAICHAEGVPLLVDEAHGGHLGAMAADLASAAAAPSGCTDASRAANTTSLAQPSVLEGGTAPADDCSARNEAAAPLVAHLIPLAPREVPVAALEAGADLVMHSTHKVLTAMTQAAMLHLRDASRVDPSRVSKALQVLQTSSPSYLLLSSLDAARRHAFSPGVWLTPLAAAASAREQLAVLPGVLLMQDGNCAAQQSAAGFDPLRLVVNVQGLNLSGYQAAAWLEEQHGIVPELATSTLVVFVFGPGSTHDDAAALVGACQQLCSVYGTPDRESRDGKRSGLQVGDNPQQDSSPSTSASPTCRNNKHKSQQGHQQPPTQQQQAADGREWVIASPALTPRQAFFADTEAVALGAAAGRVSAELLCPYPPGVPAVFPGEMFTKGAIQLLQDTLAAGGVVTGGHDSDLHTVLVVRQVCCSGSSTSTSEDSTHACSP